MLEDLLNFLFGRKALQSASQTGTNNPIQQSVQSAPSGPGNNAAYSPQMMMQMAQQQADEELRKKLAKQRMAQPNFMGPIQPQ